MSRDKKKEIEKDKRLVQAILNGDKDSYWELYGRYDSYILRKVSEIFPYKDEVWRTQLVDKIWDKFEKKLIYKFNPQRNTFENFLWGCINMVCMNELRSNNQVIELLFHFLDSSDEDDKGAKVKYLYEANIKNLVSTAYENTDKMIDKDNEVSWYVEIMKFSFTDNAGKPHQILVYYYKALIYPAKEGTHYRLNKIIIEDLADKTIKFIADSLPQDYEDFVEGYFDKKYMKPLFRRIEKREVNLKIADKQLREYLENNPSGNIDTWKKRVRKKIDEYFWENIFPKYREELEAFSCVNRQLYRRGEQ